MRYLTLSSARECRRDGARQESIVLWINRPEIQDQTALSDVTDDRRISMAQPVQQVRIARQGQRLSDYRSLRSRSATHEGLRFDDFGTEARSHSRQAGSMYGPVYPKSIQRQRAIPKVKTQHSLQASVSRTVRSQGPVQRMSMAPLHKVLAAEQQTGLRPAKQLVTTATNQVGSQGNELPYALVPLELRCWVRSQ